MWPSVRLLFHLLGAKRVSSIAFALSNLHDLHVNNVVSDAIQLRLAEWKSFIFSLSGDLENIILLILPLHFRHISYTSPLRIHLRGHPPSSRWTTLAHSDIFGRNVYGYWSQLRITESNTRAWEWRIKHQKLRSIIRFRKWERLHKCYEVGEWRAKSRWFINYKVWQL
jgi:hypothetical protein